MRICIIGSGYVGLVTGACFAEMGNHVICVDMDKGKIQRLQQGIVPIFEPGLESLVQRNQRDDRLTFTSSILDGLKRSEIVFIAVGTPPQQDGTVDLGQVLAAAQTIGETIDHYTTVVMKSTVPVGTSERVAETIQEALSRRKLMVEFDVVSNPEFLKEGAAVNDFMRPDRIVIGSQNQRAIDIMRRLYAPFIKNHDLLLIMGLRDAEMTKYAANAMLATRISFINEIAALCERTGVDIEHVRKGIGSDQRIGYSFIYAGCGYGGSCFPKDVQALIHMGRHNETPMAILEMVHRRNDQQKLRLFEKVIARFGADLSGLVFCLWGLSFKPDTDDVREATSLVLIEKLVTAGARVQAFDPVAAENVRGAVPQEWILEGKLMLFDDQYESLQNASALLLVTEWRQFRNLDLDRAKKLLKTLVIFDGRNQYDPEVLKKNGAEYFGIGR